ncbi:MAG: HIT domain-containing protein [Gammaproteobacteria bacterium]|nr:HIT domain-containing protein [Gammaproteobacteria bacterium]
MMSENFELHAQLAKDSIWLADWPLCQLRLINDSNYPWFILVPRRANIRDVIDLSDEEQAQLWQESAKLSRLLRQKFSPEKLNLAALGNMVPQLHLHHVARFSSDAAWPSPIWGKVAAIPYTEQQLVVLLNEWSVA